MTYKLLYLPTAEEVETPDWLYNTREAYTNFINDPETRFYIPIIKYNTLQIFNDCMRIRYTLTRPEIEHLRIGNEVEKYLIEIVEIN